MSALLRYALMLASTGLVFAGPVLAGKSDPPQPRCVEDLSELPLLKAHIKGERSAKSLPFARNARCLRFSDGHEEPVMVYAVTLPSPVQITVEVDNRRKTILAARIEALDEHHELVAAYPFDAFTRRGGHYSLTLFGNDPDRPIRYLLVRIDGEAIGRTDTRMVSSMAFFPLPGGSYNHSYESRLISEMGDTGWIEVEQSALTEE